MNRLEELEKEIKTIRMELEEALLEQQKFDDYYAKSRQLDELIDEYMELRKKNKKD